MTELKCFYSSADVIYQQISRQIRLKIIWKVCQIARYIHWKRCVLFRDVKFIFFL